MKKKLLLTLEEASVVSHLEVKARLARTKDSVLVEMQHTLCDNFSCLHDVRDAPVAELRVRLEQQAVGKQDAERLTRLLNFQRPSLQTEVVSSSKTGDLIAVGGVNDDDEEVTEGERIFLAGWQPTSDASEKDIEESRRVSKQSRAVLGRCWFNARNAILRLDDYADASLIEGWALLGGVAPIEHGWIVKDDKIIDPTLCDRPMIYLPGLEFRGRKEIEEFDQFSRLLRRRKKSDPFSFAFGWGGMESPSMRHCFDSAMARCTSA